MTSNNVTEAEPVEPSETAPSKSVDDRLIDELVGRAQAEGLQLTGEGGLLQQLTKRLLESALEGEITDHLGYDTHDPAGKNGGNSRNGTRGKTVLTDVGPVEIAVPRDREGSFEPKIVKKRQKRLSGVDEMVISLAAKGLTTGEVQAHLAEVYGAEVSRQTISTITDKVLEGMAEWQNRPLDGVYPVVFIDAIHVKIRDGALANRPIYVALAVTVEGRRDILGLWAGDGGEGAKHWMHSGPTTLTTSCLELRCCRVGLVVHSTTPSSGGTRAPSTGSWTASSSTRRTAREARSRPARCASWPTCGPPPESTAGPARSPTRALL